MRKTLLGLAVFLATIAPMLAMAHSDGPSLEKLEGALLMDIGQDEEFAVGQETLLDIALYTTKDSEPTGLAEFSSVKLRIFSGAQVQLDTKIVKTETTKVFANFLPTRSGNWRLSAEFFQDDVRLAASEFPIVIDVSFAPPQPPVSTSAVFAILIVILACTAWCGMYFMRSR